jgi:hypothetical protein
MRKPSLPPGPSIAWSRMLARRASFKGAGRAILLMRSRTFSTPSSRGEPSMPVRRMISSSRRVLKLMDMGQGLCEEGTAPDQGDRSARVSRRQLDRHLRVFQRSTRLPKTPRGPYTACSSATTPSAKCWRPATRWTIRANCQPPGCWPQN